MANLSLSTSDHRRKIIEQVRAIMAREGLELTPEEIAVQEQFVAGTISLDELKKFRALRGS